MRDLTWKQLLDLVADEVHGGEEDPGGSNEVWSEIRARLTILANGRVPAADRDDVIQDVLVRIRNPSVFETIHTSRVPHAYVMRMISNRAADLIRRRRPLVPLQRETATATNPHEASEVGSVLSSATPEERELLYMRFWLGLSLGEIATELGLPYSTVAKRLFRLLSRLRQLQRGAN